MDSFFDTSVVIHYGSFSKLVSNPLIKKCYEYITNKNENFLLGYYIEDEIRNRVRKRRIIYQEVINKILKPHHDFEKSSLFKDLNEKDRTKVKQLYESYKKLNSIEVKKIFTNDQSIFEMRIEKFLKSFVDERVIQIEEIRQDFLSIVKENGYSHADCMVLTSALQAQEKREIFYFVVADKHFDPNGYEFLKGDPRLKDIKFPLLKNFVFES